MRWCLGIQIDCGGRSIYGFRAISDTSIQDGVYNSISSIGISYGSFSTKDTIIRNLNNTLLYVRKPQILADAILLKLKYDLLILYIGRNSRDLGSTRI
jgi:hypothetical protein